MQFLFIVRICSDLVSESYNCSRSCLFQPLLWGCPFLFLFMKHRTECGVLIYAHLALTTKAFCVETMSQLELFGFEFWNAIAMHCLDVWSVDKARFVGPSQSKQDLPKLRQHIVMLCASVITSHGSAYLSPGLLAISSCRVR